MANVKALPRMRPTPEMRFGHCPHGHPYDEENTRIKNGSRICRACGREYDRRRRQLAA